MNWLSFENCLVNLLKTGQITPQWLDEYWSFLQRCRHTLLVGSDWPAEAFQVCHGVVLYLPLRYRAYVGFGRDVNRPTENLLAELRSKTEMTLWTCATENRQEADSAYLEDNDSKDPSRKLAALVLGNRSPVGPAGLSMETWSLWYKAYVDAAEAFVDLWHDQPKWPRWTCLSLHFASLAIELLIQKKVSLDAYSSTTTCVQDILQTRSLARLGVSTRVLIERWLEWCATPVDHAGLPEVGTIHQGQALQSVRTVSEKAILYPTLSNLA